MNDELPELDEKQIRDKYLHIAGYINEAYSFVRRYRTEGPAVRMKESELCGLAEACVFLESAESGLFDNRDPWNLCAAQFMVDKVRPNQRPVGGMDVILDKSASAMHAIQNAEKPDAKDLETAEKLLYDIVLHITGEPPVYTGICW